VRLERGQGECSRGFVGRMMRDGYCLGGMVLLHFYQADDRVRG
jgi:hypothetical protein